MRKLFIFYQFRSRTKTSTHKTNFFASSLFLLYCRISISVIQMSTKTSIFCNFSMNCLIDSWAKEDNKKHDEISFTLFPLRNWIKNNAVWYVCKIIQYGKNVETIETIETWIHQFTLAPCGRKNLRWKSVFLVWYIEFFMLDFKVELPCEGDSF